MRETVSPVLRLCSRLSPAERICVCNCWRSRSSAATRERSGTNIRKCAAKAKASSAHAAASAIISGTPRKLVRREPRKRASRSPI
jgi:hypothetical protein